jgi:hypothetical protein
MSNRPWHASTRRVDRVLGNDLRVERRELAVKVDNLLAHLTIHSPSRGRSNRSPTMIVGVQTRDHTAYLLPLENHARGDAGEHHDDTECARLPSATLATPITNVAVTDTPITAPRGPVTFALQED